MNWFRGSARDEILRDIRFDKKGAAASGGGGPSAKGLGIGAIVMIIFMIVGVIAIPFLYQYTISDRGQATIAAGVARAQQAFSNNPVADTIAASELAGQGGYFKYNVNAESREKGIQLNDFTPITGTQLPAGASFDLRYEINFENVANEPIDTTFYCEMRPENTDSDVELVPVSGEIIPNDQLALQAGIPVSCRIDGSLTEELDGQQLIYGWFEFPFTTDEAVLPVYLTSGEFADSLDEDEDFFEAFGLDVKQNDLRVTYNGEPVSVAIGTGAAGEGDQPVVVRENGIGNNIVGITLKNEWKGEVVDITDMELLLPTYISLNDDLNTVYSCPFVAGGEYRGSTVYVLSEQAKAEVFAPYFDDHSFYANPDDFFGEEDVRIFQCWIDIDEGIFVSEDKQETIFEASVSYVYQVQERFEVISIIGKGDDTRQESLFS
jgi:hypothetical protein